MRIVQRLLFAAGLCLLGYAAFMYGYARAYQVYLTYTYHPELPAVSKSAPWVPVLREGMPVARLEIPRLDLSMVVLEGVGDSTLDVAAGHVPETPLPGKAGNVGIAGHRDTFFRPLRNIHEGDVIRLSTPNGIFDYSVEWMRIVKPLDVDVLEQTPDPALTLVTCYPFYYVGSAPDRFIVRARQLTTSAAAGAGREHPPSAIGPG
jgi:sortase A